MSTQIIPTDKNGNVYYGPRTLKQADQMIEDMREDGVENAGAKMADKLKEAGFARLSALVRKKYC